MTGKFASKETDFWHSWPLSFHNQCVCRMHCIVLEQTEKNRITTVSLEGKLGIQAIQATLDDRCLRLAGHIARMPEDRAPKCPLVGWVQAKRPIGRPRMTAAYCIRGTIKGARANPEKWGAIAHDRDYRKFRVAQLGSSQTK